MSKLHLNNKETISLGMSRGGGLVNGDSMINGFRPSKARYKKKKIKIRLLLIPGLVGLIFGLQFISGM